MLHNVDKEGVDRTNPRPNTHDTIHDNIGRTAHGTQSVNYLPPGSLPSTQSQLFNAQKTLVLSDSVNLINNGATVTTVTVPHGLGYAPLIEASLNNASTSGIPGIVNIPLPMILGASFVGGQVEITAWVFPLVDATNVYFQLYNGTGNPITITLTYYLYRQTQTA